MSRSLRQIAHTAAPSRPTCKSSMPGCVASQEMGFGVVWKHLLQNLQEFLLARLRLYASRLSRERFETMEEEPAP